MLAITFCPPIVGFEDFVNEYSLLRKQMIALPRHTCGLYSVCRDLQKDPTLMML